jgi:hypothetical protein
LVISCFAKLSQNKIELLSKILLAGEFKYLGKESSSTLHVKATICHVKFAIGKIMRHKNLSLKFDTKIHDSKISFSLNHLNFKKSSNFLESEANHKLNFFIVSKLIHLFNK